jgi:CMP/dCMP kinase
MKKINIAVEGPVASGKGTISWNLAQKLGYTYMDTGAMWRSLTLTCLRNNIDVKNESEVARFLESVKIEYLKPEDPTHYKCKILINGEDVTPFIRTQQVAENTPYVAGYDSVRPKVVKLEREMAAKGGAIIEGRAVVEEAMPDADLKVYLTASLERRAKRRFEDLIKLGEKVTLEEVTKRIQDRDEYDQSREFGKLTIQPDAFILDTSNLSREEVLDILYQKAVSLINS